MNTISVAQLSAALSLRDLTDPDQGPHAVQHITSAIEDALGTAWKVPVRQERGSRIVAVAENYDQLRYSKDAVTRDSRYSRYIDGTRMLRSHTTAAIPGLLRLSTSDTLWSVAGICYRRDSIDRHHTATPHQLDLWRIRPSGPPLTEIDLEQMAELIVQAILPGRRWWTIPSEHPYTVAGREIYAEGVEIGECGLVHPDILRVAGLNHSSGLAAGLGLDRLVMLAKGIPDIRLLRSDEPRIAGQMLDLHAYRPVSAMPATVRDLSIAVDAGLDLELLGDQVRELLGSDADAIEAVEVMQRTAHGDLPAAAVARMGMRAGQDNVLLRVVIRHPSRTLTALDANLLRDKIYAGLHQGTKHEWTLPGHTP